MCPRRCGFAQVAGRGVELTVQTQLQETPVGVGGGFLWDESDRLGKARVGEIRLIRVGRRFADLEQANVVLVALRARLGESSRSPE